MLKCKAQIVEPSFAMADKDFKKRKAAAALGEGLRVLALCFQARVPCMGDLKATRCVSSIALGRMGKYNRREVAERQREGSRGGERRSIRFVLCANVYARMCLFCSSLLTRVKTNSQPL